LVSVLSELIRTFIAVEIESLDVLRELVKVKSRLVETGAEIKPVEDENIHLTLRFIGEIPAGLVKVLCNEVASIKYPKFKMHVKGLGAFPNISRPRVIWAGVAEGADKLAELAGIVERIVRRLGIPPEREEFVPHITLARVKGSKGVDRLVRAVMDMQDVDFGYTDVTKLHVKKSVLTPSGPIYSDLCTVELQ